MQDVSRGGTAVWYGEGGLGGVSGDVGPAFELNLAVAQD